MHHLEMPFAQPCLHIDCDERITKQVVTGPMPAVFIHQRHANGDVDEAEVRIGRIRRPRIVLADTFAADLGTVLPCLRTKLAWLRNEVEFPQLTTGVHIEATHEARNVMHANRVVAVNGRVADDDHAVDDDRR